MLQIDTITPEQQLILDAAADEWMKIGLQTGPGDWDKTVAGVKKAYVAAKFTPPRFFVHMQSPFAGALSVCVVKELCAALADLSTNTMNDKTTPMFKALNSVKAGNPAPVVDPTEIRMDTLPLRVVEDTWSQLAPQMVAAETALPDAENVFYAMGIPTGQELEALKVIWSFVRKTMYAQIDAWSLAWESAPVYGAHDAAWLAFYDTLGKLGMQETVEPMTGMMEVAKESGWWWPLTDVAVITDRPMLLNRNAEGDLHCTDGPAIKYADDWALWAINRVVVTKQIVEAPETLTIDQIVKESNAEIKRIMLERYGAENFIRNSGAKKLDASDYGILWRADAGENEPLVMVEVVCPSTDRMYMLRVPPTMERARQAVAWTFGYDDEKQYEPTIQA